MYVLTYDIQYPFFVMLSKVMYGKYEYVPHIYSCSYEYVVKYLYIMYILTYLLQLI